MLLVKSLIKHSQEFRLIDESAKVIDAGGEVFINTKKERFYLVPNGFKFEKPVKVLKNMNNSIEDINTIENLIEKI